MTGPDGEPEQWYLHLFAAEQPDLDWTNPEVRAEFESILRFWLDRGVDGFRIDVAHGLAKDPAMPDLAGRYVTAGPAQAGHPHWDQDAVHEVYRGWRRVSDAYPGDRTFVAEAWVETPEQLARYVRPDELHTAFNFNFLLAPWDAAGAPRGDRPEPRSAGRGRRAARPGSCPTTTWSVTSPAMAAAWWARGGRARRRCCCWRCLAAPTSTRVTSSA